MIKLHYNIVLVYIDFVPGIVLQDVHMRILSYSNGGTHEQECWAHLEVRPIVSDHPLQYFRVHQRPVKESGRHRWNAEAKDELPQAVGDESMT